MIKITIILLTILIVGTLLIIPDVNAAPGNQGKPFEVLWNAIHDLGQTLGTTTCDDGQVVKWDDASGQWICANDISAVQLKVQTVDGNLAEAFTPKTFSSTATCPEGTTLTGGGYKFLTFSSSVEGIMIENRQINDQQWRAQFSYDADGSGTYRFQAIANCASIMP